MIRERLRANPGPASFANGSPHFMVAAWEVLFDLILGFVHPTRMDVVIEEVQGAARRGEDLGLGMERVMKDWSASMSFGRTTSIATRLADHEIFDTIRAYCGFVGLLDREADLDLAPDFAALESEGLSVAGVLNEMLTQARTERGHRAAAASKNGHLTLSLAADGSHVISASDTGSFVPDGRFDEVRALTVAFIRDFDGPHRSLTTTTSQYPGAWEPRIREAVALKRRGSFLASARVYVDLSRESGMVYPGIALGLYKTVASAGELAGATLLIINSLGMYSQPGGGIGDGKREIHEDHLLRLTDSIASREALHAYLRDINGNAAYRLPRSYDVMFAELAQGLGARVSSKPTPATPTNVRTEPSPKKLPERTPMSAQPKSSGACYIATAVYGSYDAPPVMTLRRFRDEALAPSAVGRWFIRGYYALSPSLASHFSSGHPMNALGRRLLDVIVARLEQSRS